WDNAPVPHVGRSRELALRLPGREERRAAARDATQALATAADSVSAEQRRLADRTADLAQERSREAPEGGNGRETAGRQAGALPFDASQRADALARQQAAVSDKVRELAQAVEEVARAAAAAGVTDSAFQARLAEVRDMLQRAVTPELEQRLRELQDALPQDLGRTGRDLVPPGSEQLPAALRRPRAALGRARLAMGRAAQAAEQRDAGSAEQSGREAEDALDDLPEMLRARRDSLAGEWRRETLDALDRAMSEAAALAGRQAQVADGLRQPGGSSATRTQQASIE